METARARSVVLTARTENQPWGANDFADTIKRLQAFEESGRRRPVRAGPISELWQAFD
ncbi:hypothetical protein ABZ342_27955 [Amycolatopsis sp. NPDC005961]|uniref:hypothetical protein n=1 Tax=Amycolatopsis sp. NPDC005961 TaxID=3156720 RepID=UPI003409AA6A